MPFQIDSPVKVARAVYFRPAMGTPGLFRPNLDEVESFLELRIAHNLVAERAAPRRDYLNDSLHSIVRFNAINGFATLSCRMVFSPMFTGESPVPRQLTNET